MTDCQVQGGGGGGGLFTSSQRPTWGAGGGGETMGRIKNKKEPIGFLGQVGGGTPGLGVRADPPWANRGGAPSVFPAGLQRKIFFVFLQPQAAGVFSFPHRPYLCGGGAPKLVGFFWGAKKKENPPPRSLRNPAPKTARIKIKPVFYRRFFFVFPGAPIQGAKTMGGLGYRPRIQGKKKKNIRRIRYSQGEKGRTVPQNCLVLDVGGAGGRGGGGGGGMLARNHFLCVRKNFGGKTKKKKPEKFFSKRSPWENKKKKKKTTKTQKKNKTKKQIKKKK